MLTSDAPIAVQTAAARLAHATPIRRGSLSERYVKCSKPSCPCATDDNARHGPYFSWTRQVNGKTQSRFLTREQADVVRRQIDAGQEFRADVEAFWDACEVWADEQLPGWAKQTAEAVEKKGSRRASKVRSARRSSA